MKNRIKLFKGRFYSNYKTGGAHPALIIKKDKKHNEYLCVVFDSTNGRHRTKLKHPISENERNSYVQNRPLISKKNDFGNHILCGLKIHKEDKMMIKVVSRRKPRYSSSFKLK